MRALLFASAAALALTACDQAADTAAIDEMAAETEAEIAEETQEEGTDVAELDGGADVAPAPAGPPGGPGGPGGPNPIDAQIEQLRQTNPRIGPDLRAEFVPDPNVAEQRPPNALELGGQTPAFENQTRAPIPEETHTWRVEEVASGFDHPWALEFLPDGSALITERNPGTMRLVSPDGEVSDPITGVPEVFAAPGSQGGLFDVALAPDFETSRKIYFSYAAPVEDGKNTTVLATATLPEGASQIENVEEIFRMEPAWASPGHYGGRIAIDEANGVLFLTLGERMLPDARVTAQTPMDHIGTVIRLNLDGSIPADNPYADGQNGAPEVWSYGHRSNQAADIDPVTGQLWTVEHGPRGGDELNHPEAGKNYGWPIIAYGTDYSRLPMGDYEQSRPGMEQPVYYWDPVIAPGGMSFYTGDLFPNWTNDLFVAGEGSQRLSRLVFNEDRTQVVGEEWLPIGARTREVKTGPDGALYVITEEENGRLLRIVPG